MKYMVSLLLLFGACSSAPQQDPRIIIIENDIKKQAMGVDIGYQQGHLDTVVRVTNGMAIKDLDKKLGVPISKDIDKTIETYTTVYENARATGNKAAFHLWKWEVERMKRLKDSDTNKLDYSVYKYTYTIKNLMDSKGESRREITNYYFFDYKDQFVGHKDDDDMKRLIRNNIESDLHPYEIAMIQLQTGME